MLPPYSRDRRIFVEITKSEHRHGGPGWKFSTCLWTPSRNRAGADRYSIMRQPSSNDLVLHFYRHTWPDGLTESRFCGRSFVALPFYEVHDEPPEPGRWGGMAPYYRIDLRDYQGFPRPFPLNVFICHYADEVFADLRNASPRFYPFSTHGQSVRTVQGIYLAECTARLYALFRQALGLEQAAIQSPETPAQPHKIYAEGRRGEREVLFFARNPRLVADAKRRYGYACQICGFDFEATYGQLGHQYVECHHLNPLSEQPNADEYQDQLVSLDDVAVLCANCHRMVHRRRQALTLDEVRACLHTD